MAKFFNEISFTSPGHSVDRRFPASEDLVRWVDAEVEFWAGITLEQNASQQARSYWQSQVNTLRELKRLAQDFDLKVEQDKEAEAHQVNQQIQKQATNVTKGNVVTSDHAFYPAIVDLAKTNPEVAALLMYAARSDSANTLGVLGGSNLPFRSVLELIVLYSRSKGARDWLQPQRKELTLLKNDFQASLDEMRSAFAQQEIDISRQNENDSNNQQARIDEWDRRKLDLAKEWDELKRVYDEKLALLAPTQYWADRAIAHRKSAILFALAFAIAISISVAIFAVLAMPHLFAMASNRDVSPILTLIPIAVPAFAGIWVLKMLSRLLSENLQMMRDAKERETMVKTFLALMRDDKEGKSIVNDNDRILILHSLFRPSSITAVDDAPPVHWFDILTNKTGGKGSPK